MQPRTPKWLEDIRASAEFIGASISGKSIGDYRTDRLLRAAVERHFEIIGEAMKRIAAHDPETAAHIGQHPNIIAFRNVLIHGYDLVDHDRVWSVATEQLPALLAQVADLLGTHEQDPL